MLTRERKQRAEQPHPKQSHQTTEQVTSALLDSISHNLLTPLVSIKGALSCLQEEGAPSSSAWHFDDATRQALIENATAETDRLNRFIDELLNWTRIEAGLVHVIRTPCDIEDVIGFALDRTGALLNDRAVHVRLSSTLPLVSMDFTLILQVLINLLDNACKYSAPGTPIEIEASTRGANLEITIADRGMGIPPDDLLRVFDKFYRVPRPDHATSAGLGLAICKGIVQAHGGVIAASIRMGGGTVVKVTLPLEAQV